MGAWYKSAWFWVLLAVCAAYPAYSLATFSRPDDVPNVHPGFLTSMPVGKSNREQSRLGVYADASTYTQNARRRAVQKHLTGPTKTTYQHAVDYYFTNGINYLVTPSDRNPPKPPEPPFDGANPDNGFATTEVFKQTLDNGFADVIEFAYNYDGGVVDNVMYLFPALDGGSPSSVLLYSVDGGQYNTVYIPELKYDGGSI
jgi:hypothetical protein